MNVPPKVESRHADVNALARRAQAGEHGAVDALCEASVRDVTRLLVRLGAGADELDDVVQNVLLQLCRSIARFGGESTFRVWLFGLTTRVYLHHKRTHGRMRRLLARVRELVTPRTAPAADEIMEHRETLARVERRLASLGPKLRAVFVLREVEGLSGEEIARVLAIPVATVWTRLHHARKALIEVSDA
jgi:RNA polymerase sigma-70 factor (ECF subfamily)